MEISLKDREILQKLGQIYMEYASLPVQKEKKRLWEALNGGHAERPMIAVNQLPLHELADAWDMKLQCEHPFAREIEDRLRYDIALWRHCPVDMVLPPYILLGRVIGNTGFGMESKRDIAVTDPQNAVVGQYYHNQIADYEDIEKIKTPVISLDKALEEERLSLARDIFKGIAPVRLAGWEMHLGIWDWLAMWMGVENCYIELMDRPEFIHAVMKKITGAVKGQIAQANELGLFDVNRHMTHCSYTYDEGKPDCGEKNFHTSKESWGFGMAQLFSSVSPAITKEFEVDYMSEIFAEFGNIYYGCCDRLDDRLEIVTGMPNLRKISCSPWSDREVFAEKLPRNLVMSNKPSPAFLAEERLDEERIRADFRRTMDAAKKNGVGVELILKDVSTLRYDPDRLTRWGEIALEEAER